MISYKTILIMIYFNDYQDQYLLSEICDLCSFSTKQLNRELRLMQDNNLLQKNSGIYSLAEKANRILEERGLLNSTFEDLQCETITLQFRNEKLGFDDIYIPDDFRL